MNPTCACGGKITPLSTSDSRVARFRCSKCGKHYEQKKRQKKVKKPPVVGLNDEPLFLDDVDPEALKIMYDT